MEMAAVYYFAEKDRKKGEGRVLKKPEENLLFIAETCYPLWLVPWRLKTLIFDGLEFTTKTLFHNVVPDIKTFETDIQASSTSREAYLAALSQNASYFQNFASTEEKIIKGFITNPEFIHDLLDYLRDSEDKGTVETAKAILAPMMDESEVSISVDKLNQMRDRIESDINNLNRIMKLLSKLSKEQIKALQAEMKKSLKDFDKKIIKLKPNVMAKIKRIQEKRDEEITRISKKYSKKLRSLHQKRVGIERTLERFSTDIERIEADIKTCRDNKDEAGEFQLTQKLTEIKDKIPVLNKEIKDIDSGIEAVEEAKKIEVSKARTKPDDRIEDAMKCLHDLEAAKEARARLEQQELTALEDKTAAVIKQIDAMVKAKEAALTDIESVGIEERRIKQIMVYVPAYFVCYETDVGKRYVVYPPSVVGSMGIKTKLKGVFGAGKMKSFLQPRSEVISALVDRLIDLTQENPVFEKELIEAGLKANILGSTELRLGVQKGMAELRDENWISESEYQSLNNLT